MLLKDKIELPKYSLREEIINSCSHGLGSILSIIGLILLLIKTVGSHNTIGIVCCCIYALSLIVLYSCSCLYHGLKHNNGKRVLRIIDHCSIYLLIAGTYTPYTLLTLKGSLGLTLFIIVWSIAVLGIVLNAVDLKKFKLFSIISYISAGWVIIFALPPIKNALPKEGLILLVIGGILYTIGGLIYALAKKYKYSHSIFHIFVLIASILHFLSIYFYVI
ncbi:MAG: hemolysin III family protein [Bacilli bacterium]